MADSWTRNVACRYFRSGECLRGNNCKFRHAQGNRQEDEASHLVTCKFYKHGICKFGSQCHFRHTTGNGDSSSSNSNQSESVTGQQLSNTNASKSSKTNAENGKTPEEWAKAPEFVPSNFTSVAGSSSSTSDEAHGTSEISPGNSVPLSYAQAVNPTGQASSPSLEPLCPYAEATGICKKSNCAYLHGDICDLCNRAALHPFNEELRKKHTNACVKQHEVDMELSFAIQRSKDKSCGVCFETIMEKKSGEQRFGILSNCNHCFCLSCIRKWRQAKQFDNKIIRACPECRVTSDFVCPSMYWVDTKEEKDKLIKAYKNALSTKDCKHFNKGRGKCPFGNKCFYLHALPDGTKTDVGPPVRQRQNSTVELFVLQQLWELLMERDDRLLNINAGDFDPMFDVTDDSDLSDQDFL